MVFGSGGVQGRGGDGSDSDQGSHGGGEGVKRKQSDFEDSMKAMKDALVKENADKSAKISRLMQENMGAGNSSLEPGPMALPNPFAVFPLEVWERIIEMMNRFTDLQQFCLAFPQLEPLVKKAKKTIFMFENVLPLVCKYLDFKDIINCRLACGKWNQDVCALLENWITPNLLPDASSYAEVASGTRSLYYRPPQILERAYRFFDRYEIRIRNFLKKMADHSGNPFLGRILNLHWNNYMRGLERFNEPILELLRKFGKHVWNLTITLSCKPRTQIDSYRLLHRILIYLPNLRHITFHFDSYETKMAVQARRFPFPPLPYLQSLKLFFISEKGAMNAFSPLFSKQIRQLELLKTALRNADFNDECFRGLINLEYLLVELTSTKDILGLLKFPSRNLKKICLRSSNYYPFPFLPVSFTSDQVGDLLEKFSRLEHLDLKNYKVTLGSSVGSRMRFSRLKILKITIQPHECDLQHNLDFLLWLPTLKHLMILRSAGTEHLDATEMDKHSTLKIRKYLFTKQVLESNIWTLIPSLELLELEVDPSNEKYTREMFENRVG